MNMMVGGTDRMVARTTITKFELTYESTIDFSELPNTLFMPIGLVCCFTINNVNPNSPSDAMINENKAQSDIMILRFLSLA